MPARILLVDDDRFILNHLVRLLEGPGCKCTCAVSAEDAWQLLECEKFDLALLDVGLPDMDGLTLCRRLRTKHSIPIIMLTARDATSDKIVGLELGADDYIVKPFEPGELVARVRAQLRRIQEYAQIKQSEPIHIGSLTLDLDAKTVFRDGAAIPLTPLEFQLLDAFVRNRGRVLSPDWLFEHVWGWDAQLSGETVPVAIRRLRCKIESDPARPTYIHTVRGFGYRFDVVDEEHPA